METSHLLNQDRFFSSHMVKGEKKSYSKESQPLQGREMLIKVLSGKQVVILKKLNIVPTSACFLPLTQQVILCGEKVKVDALPLFTRNHMSGVHFKKIKKRKFRLSKTWVNGWLT